MKLNLLNQIYSLFSVKKNSYLIESNEDILFLNQVLTSEPILGIDTEFNWKNTYYPILSMLQISTKRKVLLIDCIKLRNLNFLKEILENKEKIIIFHSSRSDATVLSTNLNIRIENAFDIQIAERFLVGGNNKNYAAIVEKYFPIKLSKSETNSDWLKRPLSKEQISYAADDVRYLINIFEKQKKKLISINKFNDVLNASKKEANLGNQDLYVSRLAKLSDAKEKEKKLFMWRENLAIKKNIPSSFIFKDKHLKEILKVYKSSDGLKKLTNLIGSKALAKDIIENVSK